MPVLLTDGESRGHCGHAGLAEDVGAMLQGREQVSLWRGEASSLPPSYC